MHKIIIVALTAVLTISAVEWEIEQVQTHPDTGSAYTYLVLDSGQKPHILYFQADYDETDFCLSLSTKPDQSWKKKRVTSIDEFDYSTILSTLAADDADNLYVAYTDYVASSDHYEMFLACDSSGQFESKQLTEGVNYPVEPVVKIGPDGTVHIVYVEFNFETEACELRHGWISAGEFQSEMITDKIFYFWYIIGLHDFDLGEDEGMHVFYSNDSFYLSHASKSYAYNADWNIEQVTNHYSWWPSIDIDGNGKLHVCYRAGENADTIRYLTDAQESWEDEFVAVTSESDDILEWPSMAVDDEATPHIVWSEPNQEWYYDMHYAGRTDSGWQDELITDTPEHDEYGGIKHTWRIDEAGYGHLGYALMLQTEDMPHVYYAKTTEPLNSGIAESPPQLTPQDLRISGSNIFFNLPAESSVKLDLFDAAGRKVMPLISGTYPAGEHAALIDGGQLPAGVYFVQGEIGGLPAGGKFLKVR